MSSTPIKSAKVRNAVKAALGAAVAAPLLFAAAPAMSAEVQMGETTVDIGGFVRMDMYYDFDRDAGSSLAANDAVADDFDGDGNFGADVRYTRLSLSFDTPTSAGDIGGYIEGDFFGKFHLRKAYLTYGNWLLGKNDSVFTNNFNGPTIDWAGPEGDVGSNRTPQVRYTVDMGNGSNFAIALEEDLGPDLGIGTGTPTDAYNDPRGDTPLPALALRYQGQSGIFSYQVGGILRQLEALTNVTLDSDGNIKSIASSDEDTELGWGLTAGAAMAFDSGTTLQLEATYGEGINAYMGVHQVAGYGIAGAYYDANGDVQTSSNLGLVASLSQQFTDNVAASLVYGYGNVSADDYGSTADVEYTAQSVSANLFYSPVDPLTFAVGYKYVDADYDDGVDGSIGDFDGSANRVVFSTTYAF